MEVSGSIPQSESPSISRSERAPDRALDRMLGVRASAFLLRHLVALVAIGLLGAAAGFGISLTVERPYVARALIEVGFHGSYPIENPVVVARRLSVAAGSQAERYDPHAEIEVTHHLEGPARIAGHLIDFTVSARTASSAQSILDRALKDFLREQDSMYDFERWVIAESLDAYRREAVRLETALAQQEDTESWADALYQTHRLVTQSEAALEPFRLSRTRVTSEERAISPRSRTRIFVLGGFLVALMTAIAWAARRAVVPPQEGSPTDPRDSFDGSGFIEIESRSTGVFGFIGRRAKLILRTAMAGGLLGLAIGIAAPNPFVGRAVLQTATSAVVGAFSDLGMLATGLESDIREDIAQGELPRDLELHVRPVTGPLPRLEPTPLLELLVKADSTRSIEQALKRVERHLLDSQAPTFLKERERSERYVRELDRDLERNHRGELTPQSHAAFLDLARERMSAWSFFSPARSYNPRLLGCEMIERRSAWSAAATGALWGVLAGLAFGFLIALFRPRAVALLGEKIGEKTASLEPSPSNVRARAALIGFFVLLMVTAIFPPFISIVGPLSLDDVLPLAGVVLALGAMIFSDWNVRLDATMLGFLPLAVIGIVSSTANAESLGDFARLAGRSTGRILFYFALVETTRWLLTDKAWRRAAIVMLAGAATAEALFCIYAFQTKYMGPYGIGVVDFAGWSVLRGEVRVQGTFSGQQGAYEMVNVSANFLAAYLVMSTPVTLGLALASKRLNARIFAAVATLLQAITLYLTYTRAAIIALGIAILFFGWFLQQRKLTALALALGIAAVFAMPGMRAKLLNEGHDRYALWWASAAITHDHAIAGVGDGNYDQVLNKDQYYYRTPLGNAQTGSHNSIMLAAAVHGVIGGVSLIVLYVAMMGLGISAMRSAQGADRYLAAGILAAIVGYLVQDQLNNLLYIPKVATQMWFLFGLLVAGRGWSGEASAQDTQAQVIGEPEPT